jgi:hypothetical protein
MAHTPVKDPQKIKPPLKTLICRLITQWNLLPEDLVDSIDLASPQFQNLLESISDLAETLP